MGRHNYSETDGHSEVDVVVQHVVSELVLLKLKIMN
jgi:hypothetical protein